MRSSVKFGGRSRSARIVGSVSADRGVNVSHLVSFAGLFFRGGLGFFFSSLFMLAWPPAPAWAVNASNSTNGTDSTEIFQVLEPA